MEKEYLHLNKKKIKEEARRFLMSRYFNETIASHQGSISNTTLLLSLLAILFSGFSIVYASRNWIFVVIYAIFSLLGLIILISKYKRVQNNLHNERERMKKEYDELFKYHFNYAKQNPKKE